MDRKQQGENENLPSRPGVKNQSDSFLYIGLSLALGQDKDEPAKNVAGLFLTERRLHMILYLTVSDLN